LIYINAMNNCRSLPANSV